MEALFRSSSSSITATNKLLRLSNHHDCCTFVWQKKRASFVWCREGGRGGTNTNPVRPIQVSLDHVKERANVLTREQRSSSMAVDADTLVLSPNGKERVIENNSVKGLVPFNGAASLVGLREGLGIVNFLKGKKFFITGATGFLAKVLIEKILRTAPEVEKIYLLIKAKDKEAAFERLKNEVLDAELFKILRETHGSSYCAFMLKKLIPVTGNVCESHVGLELDSAEEITREVDVIVNSAASTTFDERYDFAMDINARGPCHLIRFANKCKKLKLFLQVSTAYVNGQRQGRIMEKPFSMGDCIATENFTRGKWSGLLPALDVEKEMKLTLEAAKWFRHHEDQSQKMKELGIERARRYGWQDTYVFTKAMGEMMINSKRGDVPVVIIRPSVIESTYKDPFPGWMEGNRMLDPIILNYGKGQLTGFPANRKAVIDVVPVDMVVNATLAAIAKHGTAAKPEINVYHVASSVVNPLFIEDLALHFYHHYKSSPSLDSKGMPIIVSAFRLFESMDDFSNHIWRNAQERSGLTGISSSNEKMVQKLELICRKSVKQAKYLANIYEPYSFYGGRFDNSNVQRLMENMSEEEKREFGFDVGRINWKDYITNVHIPGLRRHVMKGRV